MKKTVYQIAEKIFIYPGETANWHFLPVSKSVSDLIKAQVPSRRGFGAVKVEVTIGETVWQTSIFPNKDTGAYILPVKAIVRRKEHIYDGEVVKYSIKLI